MVSRIARLQLARLAVEALAIIGSILVPFGIDAWWERRKDRAAEHDLLASLNEEFRANLETLSTAIPPILPQCRFENLLVPRLDTERATLRGGERLRAWIDSTVALVE